MSRLLSSTIFKASSILASLVSHQNDLPVVDYQLSVIGFNKFGKFV